MGLSLALNTKPRNRYVKSLSLGLNDLLFTPARMPWIIVDLILVFLLFQVGIWLSPFGVWGRWLTPQIVLGTVFTLAYCAVGLGLGSYDRVSRFDYGGIARGTVFATFLAGIIGLSIFYFAFYEVVGRWTIVYGSGAALIGSFPLRMALAWILRQNPYRFTIIGQSRSMDEVVTHFSVKRRHHHFYVYKPWDEIFPPGEPPTIERLLAAKVGDIVLSSEVMTDAKALDFAIHSLEAKFRVVDELTFYAQTLERFPTDEVSRAALLQQGLARRQILTVALKRLSDIVIAAIALLVLSPLLLVIAAIIRLTSPGPALFTQVRQGRYSQPFKMYKFRTMRSESGDHRAAGGFTKVSDSRVTWIGRILRPLHFDELPQLVNILIGDMSLVGPRPEAIDFAKRMREQIPLYELRYLVRPGLTGHAQLNQGYAMDNVLDTKTKLSFDLYYLCNHSLWMDFQLMLRTVFFLTQRAR